MIILEKKSSKEEARRKLQINLEDKVILFFGFIRKYKGLGYFIECNEIIKSTFQLKI